MHSIVLIACDGVDEALRTLDEVTRDCAGKRCSVVEYAVVRADAEVTVESSAVVDSDEDYDDLDGLVGALVDAAAGYRCACDAEPVFTPADAVVDAAEVFKVSGAALAMLVKAHRQDDLEALLAPYGDAAVAWDASEVRKVLREERRLEREEVRAEHAAERAVEREGRREAREERREERQAERAVERE